MKSRVCHAIRWYLSLSDSKHKFKPPFTLGMKAANRCDRCLRKEVYIRHYKRTGISNIHSSGVWLSFVLNMGPCTLLEDLQ